MQRPIRFQCVGVWLTAGLPCICAHTYMQLYICMDLNRTSLIHRHVFDHKHAHVRLAQISVCAGPAGNVTIASSAGVSSVMDWICFSLQMRKIGKAPAGSGPVTGACSYSLGSIEF